MTARAARVSAGLPDFPVGSAGAGQGAGRRPPGRAGRPVHRHAGRPGADAHPGGAGRGRRRARLPADRRYAGSCGRRSRPTWPRAVRRPSCRRPGCCRRSAPRSWSPGCPPCSGWAPATPSSSRRSATRRTRWGPGWPARRWCGPTRSRARGRPGVGWSGSTRPATRTAGCCRPSHLRKVVDWARERGAVVASDECYLELGWDEPPVSVLSVCGG